MKIFHLLCALALFTSACSNAQVSDSSDLALTHLGDENIKTAPKINSIMTGASQIEVYLPLLKDKRIAMIVNQTSMVGTAHLVDTLLKRNIDIKVIFAPEHGFRGEADAGELVANGKDTKTGLPIISLYGKNKKPTAAQLKDVDVIIFDIQDVGARFYTYISTMHYAMEASAEHGKKIIILDRPNPNGHYIAGPVLEMKHHSFVGMHPIPIVHGCTVGELAKMINGEGWLKNEEKADLEVIVCKNYTHQTAYSLPIKPSPNLPNDLSIRLYPSLCLFEGTIVSAGRGTNKQFQVIGHPLYSDTSFSYTPRAMEGAKYPKFKEQKVYGKDFTTSTLPDSVHFSLADLIHFYNDYKNSLPKKEKPFFSSFFTNLAGTHELQKQIENGLTEVEIIMTWQNKLLEYKDMRKKYLLYID